MASFKKDLQYWKFSMYGFLKNLKFFDPYLILFFREMSFSFFQIGILFSVRELFTNLFEIPSGFIADTFGRRKAMVFSFSSYILSFLIFYFFPAFYLYFVAMIFFALGEAFRTGTHKAMILEYLKINDIMELRVDYYGSTRSWSQRGSALSAIIAAILVFYSGSYRFVFLCSVIPYIMGLLLMVSYPSYLDGSHINTGNETKINYLKHAKGLFLDFIYMLKNKPLRKGILNSSVFDAVFNAVKDYIQPIIKSLALTIPVFLYIDDKKRVALIAGLVYFLLYLLSSFASQHAGKFSRKFKSEAVAVNGTYIIGLLMVVFIGIIFKLSVPLISVLIFIMFYVLHNLRRPISMSYISGLISNKIMATGLSVESQTKTLIVAVLSPVMGLLVDNIGLSYALIILGAAILLLFPFVSIKKNKA